MPGVDVSAIEILVVPVVLRAKTSLIQIQRDEEIR